MRMPVQRVIIRVIIRDTVHFVPADDVMAVKAVTLRAIVDTSSTMKTMSMGIDAVLSLHPTRTNFITLVEGCLFYHHILLL